MGNMPQTGDSSRSNQGRIALLCVLLSLLLHVLAAWLLLQLPSPHCQTARGQTQSSRALKISRHTHLKKKALSAEQEQKAPRRPFAKTDSDRKEERPPQADFVGKRNTRAEGQSDAPQRTSDVPLPTMNGEKKEEINTIDRERQDGPVEHEGKNNTPVPPPTPSPAPGIPNAIPAELPADGQAPATTPPTDAAASHLPQQQTADALKLQPSEHRLTENKQHQQAAPPKGQPQQQGTSTAAPQPRIKRKVYDPSLADHAQPGFRTTERRSRSTGRFVLGRNPAVNVSATPLGRYEELIYRLIAHRWYAACDDHRGDIIPGRIIIAIRLNKTGSVETMNLITRRGASIIQQSFTFGAIRRAQLPPMPTAVQQELLGEQLELIFTFNFD